MSTTDPHQKVPNEITLSNNKQIETVSAWKPQWVELQRLDAGTFSFEVRLEDGSLIRVSLGAAHGGEIAANGSIVP